MKIRKSPMGAGAQTRYQDAGFSIDRSGAEEGSIQSQSVAVEMASAPMEAQPSWSDAPSDAANLQQLKALRRAVEAQGDEDNPLAQLEQAVGADEYKDRDLARELAAFMRGDTDELRDEALYFTRLEHVPQAHAGDAPRAPTPGVNRPGDLTDLDPLVREVF